ncbi:MAG TPA: ABC transporter permease [Candidatus Latescibacteria bacterium]|nr:ABC transporter permease [Candidatus Latescibacterota bacterium]
MRRADLLSLRFVRGTGRLVLASVRQVGRFVLFASEVVRALPKIFQNPRLTLEQMVRMGTDSVPLVFTVSIFAGATTAWQGKYQLEGILPTSAIGTAVAKSLILELGPVLTALVIAGRVGSSIAAELATMRVTEQIDALVTMSISPARYLIAPRVVAGFVMAPVLVVMSYFFGISGGYVTAVSLGGLNGARFLEGLRLFFYVRDVAVGLLKAFVFGASTSFLGCYFGYFARGGAEGVGQAAIRAFVSSSVVILGADFLIASIAFM